METYIRERPKLLTPGPTPVPNEVRRVALEDPIYHRSKDFAEIFLGCRKNLAQLFQTKNTPLILTSSGTGALEAAVVNFTETGDEVCVVVGGKFGERWQKLTENYECKVASVEVDPGSSVKIEDIIDSLKGLSRPKALFLQASETSTGVYHPIREITEAVHKNFPETLIVVDAVSAICAHDIRMDEWGIDVLISGSQKGFGVPPGLAFIAISDKAWKAKGGRSRFYFDLEREKKGQDEGLSAWTTATTLVQQLEKALQELCRIGPKNLARKHERHSMACREAVTAAGMELFAKESPSFSLTSFIPPAECDASFIQKHLRDHFRFQIAGGQGHLKGKIIRLAHLGFVDDFDLMQSLTALEWTLMHSPYTYSPGAMLTAALTSLDKSLPPQQ